MHEPASRFGSEETARSWLRRLTSDHLKSKGIQVASAGSSSSPNSASAVISSAALEKFKAEQDGLLRKQIELYAAYIGDRAKWDAALGERAAASAEVFRLQAELDLWLAEHGGTAYADGIKPIFSPLKARRYDSWWNWARQAASQLAHGDKADLDMIANRADADMIAFLEYLQAKTDNKAIEAALTAAKNAKNLPPSFKPRISLTGPKTTIEDSGKIVYAEVPRGEELTSYVKEAVSSGWISLSSKEDTQPDTQRTAILSGALNDLISRGGFWSGKSVLMTGCGTGSIAGEMLQGLLEGGAQVCVTTSSYNRATLDRFRAIYEKHGSRGSALVVVPFNQGSTQDISALISYLEQDLEWELDAVIPFAAVPENGRGLAELGAVDEVSGKSELAHRMMLTNVLRMLGAIAKSKESRGVRTRPAQVILPLSPNHGQMGYDGLYGESKIGLETLLNRWHSESWSEYLSIVGAVIGWTRGTGLMNENNIVAEALESLGIHTFSAQEMSLLLLGLMCPAMVRLSDREPVYADLSGAMGACRDLHLVTRGIRAGILAESARLQAIHNEQQHVQAEISGAKGKKSAPQVTRRARLDTGFDIEAKPYEKVIEGIQHKEALRDLLDLSRTVVVAGFGEVGPFGGARTRWEMESMGKLSLEGCIQLAWTMGLIRWESGSWRDAKSGEAIPDIEVKGRYEAHILAHTGIRLVEPEILEYDPKARAMMQEVVLQEDMGPLEMSRSEAQAFRASHGDKVIIDTSGCDESTCRIRFKAGCTLWVPKALQMDRFIAGQIPTGWSAERYGIPRDLIENVDRTTLFLLVCVAETLVSAGITDPYEFYQYIHLSELGNCIGAGSGGLHSLRKVYMDRTLEKANRSDILQDTFINTLPAWVNLLLLSSAGPIKTPVGACGTALQSIELGVESIMYGKARVVIVGACDDLTVESATEFGNMGATSNSIQEVAKGREPGEMSRPMAASRAGFMEAMGAGCQVLMTAELALRMGCPIYGIIGSTYTAMDREGRSVPAPGQGILGSARCVKGDTVPRVLDIEYRAMQLRKARDLAKAMFEEEDSADDALLLHRRLATEQHHWGLAFAEGDPRIAPLQAGLARFGLTIEDIDMVSCHGTGTAANDVNEPRVIQTQFEQLGRTPGNMIPTVCQKHLTGHPKGPAAAWMLNGALQAMRDNLIPANKNADSIEPKLRSFTHLFHPSRPIRVHGRIKAVLLKSFGFGQVGAELLLVHPDYLLATLGSLEYGAYLERRRQREQRTAKHHLDTLLQRVPAVKVKTSAPYKDEDQTAALLNPHSRTAYDPDSASWSMNPRSTKEQLPESLVLPHVPDQKGVGIDVQLTADIPIDNEDFLARNFSPAELAHCRSQPDARASLAGRWAAKEAIIKALCSQDPQSKPDWLAGAGAPLAPIEILPGGAAGAPVALVHGKALEVKLSISHSGAYAAAIAILNFNQ